MNVCTIQVKLSSYSPVSNAMETDVCVLNRKYDNSSVNKILQQSSKYNIHKSREWKGLEVNKFYKLTGKLSTIVLVYGGFYLK